MLLRISLIVAIVAGLAVGVLNFVQVKEKITTLQANLKTETAAHQEFLGKYTKAQSELDKTTAELAQTKTTLEATEAAKVKAETDLAATTKRADKLTEDLNKTRQERDTAQQDLAAYKVTGVTPQQILGMNAVFKNLTNSLAAAETENKILLRKLKKTETDFVDFVQNGKMQKVTKHIPREDAKWLGQILAQLSAEQIRDCFRAAGFSPDEVEMYAQVVMQRIAALKNLHPYSGD